MLNSQQVVFFEELSMNAHPALKTQLCDGWILRFSNGYTKRANSVNPIYPSVLPFDEKIAYCEKAYSDQKLPIVYKLTHELSDALDGRLESHGYSIGTPTDFMTKGIEEDLPDRSPEFQVSYRVNDDWADSFFCLNGLTDSGKINTAKHMLYNIHNTVLCGRMTRDGQTTACGLCVVERGCAGLFDIVVDRKHRGRGYGYGICASLLDEAKKLHASRAYLQVVQSNAEAIGLYKKLGFSRLYEYWYRVKTLDSINI